MTSLLRRKQITAWLILAIFIAGFFVKAIGAWTGPILGVWFVGTQPPRRGFLWMVLFGLVPALVSHGWVAHSNHLALAWALGYVLAAPIPFLVHRLLSERLRGLLWTVPFPLAQAALALALRTRDGLTLRTAAVPLATGWLAALVVYGWNLEFGRIRTGKARRPLPWNERSETLALLRSPSTGEPLRVEGDGFKSSSGERFPIRDGIPSFLRPQDLTGSNRKYNGLYQTIGGFYDDSQRVISALTGMDRDAYVRSYMSLLEVKPGDRVLETSVGTGLNFKYLPREIHRFGLDLSAEMLAACRANLRRWGVAADLFLGNAEALPFADSSFDCVFHVGGINFFSDRAGAICEMIRVARPGSLLLIADETEEHVKEAYENIPYTREFFKGRSEAVTAPIDLIPPEMEEVSLRILQVGGKNRFYALTFRKPLLSQEGPAQMAAKAHAL